MAPAHSANGFVKWDGSVLFDELIYLASERVVLTHASYGRALGWFVRLR